jgi:hypothetical protein
MRLGQPYAIDVLLRRKLNEGTIPSRWRMSGRCGSAAVGS